MNPNAVELPPAPGATSTHPLDPTPEELGRRIKLMRVSCGLTLKDLEERGGISATHVSEIERGKASPTVGALARIARALGLRPAALVEPRMLPEHSISRASDARRRVQWGAAIMESLAEPVHSATIGMHLLTLPIAREPALMHQHEGEEWVTALSGAVELRVEKEGHVLREGDSLHFRAHRMHSYANLVSTPTVLLVACRPRLAL